MANAKTKTKTAVPAASTTPETAPEGVVTRSSVTSSDGAPKDGKAVKLTGPGGTFVTVPERMVDTLKRKGFSAGHTAAK